MVSGRLNNIYCIRTTKCDSSQIRRIRFENVFFYFQNFPEILVKCDINDISQDENSAAGDDFHESFDANSKDSDFQCSDYEETVSKKPRRTRSTTKRKRKTKKESKTEANDAKPANVDPNAPKKRRNYKKRATKEKQVFECDICHYKVNHECMFVYHSNQ